MLFYKNVTLDSWHPTREIQPITALDENGRSSFQLLQGYGKAKHTPLVYYAFDLLSLDSAALRSRPLIERRKLPGVRYTAIPNLRRGPTITTVMTDGVYAL